MIRPSKTSVLTGAAAAIMFNASGILATKDASWHIPAALGATLMMVSLLSAIHDLRKTVDAHNLADETAITSAFSHGFNAR